MDFKKAEKNNNKYNLKCDRDNLPIIVGRYIDKKTDIMGKPGSNVLVIYTEGKVIYDVCTGKLLEDFFSDIEVGSVVSIEYLGKEKSKSSAGSYNNFSVSVGEEEDMKNAGVFANNKF
jgi:hypothetical protein